MKYLIPQYFLIFLCNGIRWPLFSYLLTVLNNYFFALDTTLRILKAWYKLHIMKYIILFSQNFYHINIPKRDFNHRKQKVATVLEHCCRFTSKPPRLVWLFFYCCNQSENMFYIRESSLVCAAIRLNKG